MSLVEKTLGEVMWMDMFHSKAVAFVTPGPPCNERSVYRTSSITQSRTWIPIDNFVSLTDRLDQMTTFASLKLVQTPVDQPGDDQQEGQLRKKRIVTCRKCGKPGIMSKLVLQIKSSLWLS
jgi:hypothetical protein